MKLFAKQVPLPRLAIICFMAVSRVLLVVVIGMVIVTLTGLNVPRDLNGLFSLAGVCAVGWLITHDLRIYGIPAKFPGVGAKVVTCLLILAWLVVFGALVLS